MCAFSISVLYIAGAENLPEDKKYAGEKKGASIYALILWQAAIQASDKRNDMILFFPRERKTVEG